MATINFKFEKREAGNTGTMVDTVVKQVEGQPDEEWCNVVDLDRLFDCCARKWGSNWDLDKVIAAIDDSEVR